jgi:hypothetical protein
LTNFSNIKNKAWIVSILLLAALNIILFWPGKLYFLNDDLLHIPLTDAGHFFQTNSVRPLHELLVKLDLFVWGKYAYGYHITALVLHFIVCFQLYDLTYIMQVRWLGITRDKAIKASFLAVVLFLVYPQHSESLGWILGRTPVLSALFCLLSVRLFFVLQFKWYHYVIGAFTFGASLFTYEQACFLPIVLLLLTFFSQEKFGDSDKKKYALLLCFITIVYIVVRLIVTSEVVGNYEGKNFRTLDFIKLGQNAVGLFLRLWINPGTPAVFVLSSGVFLLFVAFIFRFQKRIKINKGPFLFLVAVVVLLIVPVVSLGITVRSFESGRFLYLPSVFLISGLSIAVTTTYCQYKYLQKFLIISCGFLFIYWLFGKYKASTDYMEASLYSKSIHQKVAQHFLMSADTLRIDTLQESIHRLPVFRMGFKTGVKWLNNNIDTNKIIVDHYIDEVAPEKQ